MGIPYYILYRGDPPRPSLRGREKGGGKRKTENGKLTDPLRRFAPLSSVALGSAPLRGYRSTFSASSKDPLRPLSQGDKGNGKRKAGEVFMNEGKPGGKNEMPRNAKTRILRVRFCPPEHMNMSSGRTRASHPGGRKCVFRKMHRGR